MVERNQTGSAAPCKPDEDPTAGGNGESASYTPYQPALDAGISEEMDRVNFRRLQLAERKTSDQLNAEEEAEFKELQDKFFAYIETIFPRSRVLDDDRLEKLEQKYKDAKTS